MPENQTRFEYVLAKPVNQFYLHSVVTHVMKGLSLLSEASSPACSPSRKKRRSPDIVKGANRSPAQDIAVLLADDNEFCRTAIARLLAKHTSNITACEDGAKALETFKAAQTPFELVLADYNMPNLDGLGLITGIREWEQAHPFVARTAILCTDEILSDLVLTGEADAELEQAAIKAGANDICTPSFNIP
jgi:two-component system chemotaxis response regulator CheY